MNNQQTPWDIVAIFAMLGSLMFNQQLAQAIAPYVATFFCALIGTMWSIGRKEKESGQRMTRSEGAVFVMKVTGAALVLTVPFAIWAAPRLGFENYRFIVSPLALLIGAVGEWDDWKRLLIWVRDFVLRWKSGTPEA